MSSYNDLYINIGYDFITDVEKRVYTEELLDYSVIEITKDSEFGLPPDGGWGIHVPFPDCMYCVIYTRNDGFQNWFERAISHYGNDYREGNENVLIWFTNKAPMCNVKPWKFNNDGISYLHPIDESGEIIEDSPVQIINLKSLLLFR